MGILNICRATHVAGRRKKCESFFALSVLVTHTHTHRCVIQKEGQGTGVTAGVIQKEGQRNIANEDKAKWNARNVH